MDGINAEQEHMATPGPDMIRVFAKVNSDNDVVAIVGDVPRAETLEDYFAYDVESDAWYNFVEATKRLEDAKREAEKAMALHSEAFEHLHTMLRR